MNRDAEANIQEFLDWLKGAPTDRASPASAHQPSSLDSFTPPRVEAIARDLTEELDPLDAEDFSDFSPSSGELLAESLPPSFDRQEGQPLEIGEIPIVRKRFQALLKQRLRTEIESKLPRFPWEEEITDYEDDLERLPTLPVGIPLWTPQLTNLNLPIPIPESVLMQLLDRCQEVVASGLREGAKLVQAVESLFPNQFQMLNQLAGMVIVSPARSGTASTTMKVPQSYESANAVQQMLMSLLAAQRLLQDLTVEVSTAQPTERQWLTARGILTLTVEYHNQAEDSLLRVRGVLPCGGGLSLIAQETQAKVERATAGAARVELVGVPPNQTYRLLVQFEGEEQQHLTFAICPTIQG